MMQLIVSSHRNAVTGETYDLYSAANRKPLAYERVEDVELSPVTVWGFSEQEMLEKSKDGQFHRNT